MRLAGANPPHLARGLRRQNARAARLSLTVTLRPDARSTFVLVLARQESLLRRLKYVACV